MTAAGLLLDTLTTAAPLAAMPDAPPELGTAFVGLRAQVAELLAERTEQGMEWLVRFGNEPTVWREPLLDALDEARVLDDPYVGALLTALVSLTTPSTGRRARESA